MQKPRLWFSVAVGVFSLWVAALGYLAVTSGEPPLPRNAVHAEPEAPAPAVAAPRVQ